MQENQIYVENMCAPVNKMPTRKVGKTIILSIVTFGIYLIVLFTKTGEELNIVASKYDGKRTTNFCLICFLLGPISLYIASIIWYCKFSGRIGDELKRRNIDYSFSASDYVLWYLLGSLIIVGPFIYLAKMIKAMNLINEDYNTKG